MTDSDLPVMADQLTKIVGYVKIILITEVYIDESVYTFQYNSVTDIGVDNINVSTCKRKLDIVWKDESTSTYVFLCFLWLPYTQRNMTCCHELHSTTFEYFQNWY